MNSQGSASIFYIHWRNTRESCSFRPKKKQTFYEKDTGCSWLLEFRHPNLGRCRFSSPTFNETRNSARPSLRSRLLSFFQAHSPEKAETVDILIEKYKMKDEDDLIAQLEAKYDAKFRSIVGSGSLGNGGKQHSLGLFHFNTSASTAAPSAEGPASAVQLEAKPATKHSLQKMGKVPFAKKLSLFLWNTTQRKK